MHRCGFQRWFLRIEPASESKLSSPSTIYPFLRMMRLPRLGKAKALNAAIVEVDTDIIVAIDADTALDRHALEAMRQAFASDTSLVAAGGLLVPVCDRGPLGRMLQWFQTYEYIRGMVARFAWMSMNSLVLISGAFSAFRRDALVRVGGFDLRCIVEDYELTHRMHRYSVEHGLGLAAADDHRRARRNPCTGHLRLIHDATAALVRRLPADPVLEL